MRTRLASLFVLALTSSVPVGCGGGGDGNTSDPDASMLDGAPDGADVAVEATADAVGDAPKPCIVDGNCVGHPNGGVCDLASGACVECVVSKNTCGDGKYCDGSSQKCATGCGADADCAGKPDASRCELVTHACVRCLADADCGEGSLCSMAHLCAPGCSPTHACKAGETCCSGMCSDTSSDLANCGTCGKLCPTVASSTSACSTSTCTFACDATHADCNRNPADGCEHDVATSGACLCTPGMTEPCYDGPTGTKDVAACKGGTRTCDPTGTAFGACVGQVLPAPEICANGVDEDCTGVADDVKDADGDGWTTCNGDCCDVPGGCGTADPKLVNPGALELVGDGVDNDCDPATSDVTPPAACSTTEKLTGVTASDAAKALGLCQTTTATPPLPLKKWGLVTASQLLANGAVPTAADLATMQNSQSAIMVKFGDVVRPTDGATMLGLSTGAMRTPAQPGYVSGASGSSFASSIAFSPLPGNPLGPYLAANGNALVAATCGSATCPTGTGANDSVNVRLVVRVPTNVRGFSFDSRLFSAEYQTYQCTMFNDVFLASVRGTAAGIPLDGNVTFDSLGVPLSVNSKFLDICGGNGKSCGTCPAGTAQLAGTGLDTLKGAGTPWLTTDVPATPGETITIQFVLFDVGDHAFDTHVLLDNFRWNASSVPLSTHR